MDLQFDLNLANGYINRSQIARVLTESWVLKNVYCPNCGAEHLHDFENNAPVADFYCHHCQDEFELKSKKNSLGKIINDGAYATMINRIQADNNPNFFLLSYTENWRVKDFLIIPKHFFNAEIIIQRSPLAVTARRAGWIGCNINLSKIPNNGKIFLVKDSQILDKKVVCNAFQNTTFLRNQTKASRGWLYDILKCIDMIPTQNFSLNDVYAFESQLKLKYPDNYHIRDKIRQQLQVLRDKGLIEFIARGKYRKIDFLR